MKHDSSFQLPLAVSGVKKRQARSQFGALCYRVTDNRVQILLVTSRRRKRWIIPKGWPEWGQTPAEAAATEALEEGGVKGQVSDAPLGIYSYVKIVDKSERLPCIVA
ncbi:MAG: NUDIX domain-containing protein, partial [Pseudomonadota bacterium]